MRHASTSTGDQLVNALQALGVNFLMGGKGTGKSLHKQPARLITALAQSGEARLRLSLIPLFLEHPEYASRVRGVVRKLDPSARLTLQCYYSAAVWLSKKYQPNRASLPDHFSKDLSLTPVDDPDENLRMLAKRHKELSGSFTNWLGTYQHVEQVWRKGLEYPTREYDGQYSSNNTGEIGMSEATGRDYLSIVYLVEKAGKCPNSASSSSKTSLRISRVTVRTRSQQSHRLGTPASEIPLARVR